MERIYEILSNACNKIIKTLEKYMNLCKKGEVIYPKEYGVLLHRHLKESKTYMSYDYIQKAKRNLPYQKRSFD